LIKERKKLNAFLQQMAKDITHLFGEAHISTILHGGIVLREFSPDFSDIDLVVVLKRATQAEAYAWAETWEHWCRHPFGEKVWAHLLSMDQLEGKPSMGWTISKKGIHPFSGLPIDVMELHTLIHHGKVLAGEPIIDLFPQLPSDYSIKGLEKFIRILKQYSGVSPLQPYRQNPFPTEDEISLLLTFPRHLYNLKTDQILTKCQAARWYAKEKGSYRDELLHVANYRMNPKPDESKAMITIFESTPSILTYFWQSYFEELHIEIDLPHPIVTPLEVSYGETFAAIQKGLQLVYHRI
jgi:hypothetical protein